MSLADRRRLLRVHSGVLSRRLSFVELKNHLTRKILMKGNVDRRQFYRVSDASQTWCSRLGASINDARRLGWRLRENSSKSCLLEYAGVTGDSHACTIPGRCWNGEEWKSVDASPRPELVSRREFRPL